MESIRRCRKCHGAGILILTYFWEEAQYHVACTVCSAKTYKHADDELAIEEWNKGVLKDESIHNISV